MHQVNKSTLHETQDELVHKLNPRSYALTDLWSANVDLLKTLLTNPNRAMKFPIWTYATLFITTLAIFSLIHSSMVILTEEFSSYELITFLTGVFRIFGSTIVAVLIAVPGVVFLWVLTPNQSFLDTFKRFILYYETVVLFSLLGELFFCKFIIESSMKLQPFVILITSVMAIQVLKNSLEDEPTIQITNLFIVGILSLSYLQAFLIIDGLLPYHLQDNINSPIVVLLKAFFSILG